MCGMGGGVGWGGRDGVGGVGKFPRNFREFSEKFPEFSGKFPEILMGDRGIHIDIVKRQIKIFTIG